MRPEEGVAAGHPEPAAAADDGELPADGARHRVARVHDERAAVEGPVGELEVHAEDERQLALPGRDVDPLRVAHHPGLPLGALGEHVVGRVHGAEGRRVVGPRRVEGVAADEHRARVLPAQGVVEEEVQLGGLLLAQRCGGAGLEGHGGGREQDGEGEEQGWRSPHGVFLPLFLGCEIQNRIWYNVSKLLYIKYGDG
ncbi:hypothetical protein BS78_01G039800 [Paspalum vaginatum]|nr:hypothetical protein BS78_01G039800 [Paspalum vaginatum]